MAKKPKPPKNAASLPPLVGECGRVRVVFDSFPGLRGEDGVVSPVQQFAVDDGEGGWEELDTPFFVSIRLMFAIGSYTMKLKEYLPRLIFQCKQCQKTLPEEPTQSTRFDCELTALDIHPFRASMMRPAVACPQCGRHNVLWNDAIVAEIEGATRKALGVA